MKALYGYSSHPVTWTEEIKQHFYPTQSTRSTPAINSKALWSIARVDRVNYVGLICNLLPYSPFAGHLPRHICPEIFMELYKAPSWETFFRHPMYMPVAPEWQSVDHSHLGNTPAIPRAVCQPKHTERGSCDRTDKPERTSIIDWLEKAEGVGQGC